MSAVIFSANQLAVASPDVDHDVNTLLVHVFHTAETIYESPWDIDSDYTPSYRILWPRGEPEGMTIQVKDPMNPNELAFTVQVADGKIKRFGRRFEIDEAEDFELSELLERLLLWAEEQDAADH